MPPQPGWGAVFPRAWVHAIPALLFAWGALAWFGGAPEVPHDYSGDSLWHAQVLKSIAEGGWAQFAPRLGAPFGASYLDYPNGDLGFHLLAWLIGRFTADGGLIFNVLYALGFPLAYGCAYAVLRDWDATPVLAAAGALAFAILPFHFLRTGHLFLATYFVVPIIVWLCVRLWSLEAAPAGGLVKANKGPIAAATLSGGFGVYYAFFGAMLFCAVGLVAALRKGSARPLALGLVLAAATTLVIAANLAPSLLYRAEYGANPDVSFARGPESSQIYGLNLALTLLPHDDHRIAAFDRWGDAARATTPTLNENQYGYVGVLAAIGTLALLLRSLGAPSGGATQLAPLACVSLVCILYGTISGFGYLFSLFVSPEIRGLNRLSVFLGFTGIAALVLLLSSWASGRPRRRLAAAGVAIILGVVALVDQVPKSLPPERSSIIAAFRHDRAFVSRIESALPAGARVLQLPYIEYPEQPPRAREAPLALVRPYLHSVALSWSHGSMRGRSPGEWIRTLAQLPAPELSKAAAESGFSGIHLDGDAFADNGAALRAALSRSIGRDWVASPSGRQFFIALDRTGDRPSELAARPTVGGEFYAWEEAGPDRWAWCRGNGVMQLLNVRDVARTVDVELELAGLSDHQVAIWLNDRPLGTFPAPSAAPAAVKLAGLQLRPGENALRLRSDGEARTPGTGDPRRLSFQVRNPRVSEAR